MRFIKYISIGIFVLLFFALAFAYAALRGSLPQLYGEISSNISAPVEISRDENGVPFIKGKSREDVAYALGFLHGQERFFQMDTLRRAGAGELSELVGDKALELDKSRRIHRFRARIKTLIPSLSKAHISLLKRYVEGVNFGLNQLKTKPFEYILLGQEPRPWQMEDTFLAVAAMYFDLQGRQANYDLFKHALKENLSPSWFQFIAPNGGSYDASLYGDSFAVPQIPNEDLNAHLKIDIPKIAQPIEEPASIGSNNWAISGAINKKASANNGTDNQTSNQAGIISNDMHLSLRLPHIWYRATWQVEGKSLISGASLPGVPLIVVGSNRHVAWGFTNSYANSGDVIAVQTKDNKTYLLNGQSYPLKEYLEVIKVAGKDDVEMKILETQWGPVLAQNDNQLLSYAWTAYGKDGFNLNPIDMEEIKTVEAAIKSAPYWGIPNQNLMVADKTGNIGWTITSPLPQYDARQKSLVENGDYNLPWVSSSGDVARPSIINPSDERLWTANSRVVSIEDFKTIGDSGYALGARAKQIKDLLYAAPAFDEQDLLKIALDNRALFMERWYQQLDKELNAERLKRLPQLKAIKQALEDWGGHANASSRSYLLTKTFRDTFKANTLNRIYAPIIKAQPLAKKARVHDEYALWAMVSQKPENALLSGDGSWTNILDKTLLEVLQESQKTDGQMKTWGEVNQQALAHPFADVVPLVGKFLKFPVDQYGGDEFMPNVLRKNNASASERMIVSPGNEAEGIFHMPGSQSGHPLSPYWAKGHQDWAEGKPSPFLPQKAKWVLELKPQ